MSELRTIETDRRLEPTVMAEWINSYITGLVHENTRLKQQLADIEPLFRRLTLPATKEELEVAHREYEERLKNKTMKETLEDILLPYLEEQINKTILSRRKIDDLLRTYIVETTKNKEFVDCAKDIKAAYMKLEPYRHEIVLLDQSQLKLREAFAQYNSRLSSLGLMYNSMAGVLETEIAKLHQIGGDAALAILKDLSISHAPAATVYWSTTTVTRQG